MVRVVGGGCMCICVVMEWLYVMMDVVMDVVMDVAGCGCVCGFG